MPGVLLWGKFVYKQLYYVCVFYLGSHTTHSVTLAVPKMDTKQVWKGLISLSLTLARTGMTYEVGKLVQLKEM